MVEDNGFEPFAPGCKPGVLAKYTNPPNFERTETNACIETHWPLCFFCMPTDCIHSSSMLRYARIFCSTKRTPSPRPPICNCFECVAGSRFLCHLEIKTQIFWDLDSLWFMLSRSARARSYFSWISLRSCSSVRWFSVVNLISRMRVRKSIFFFISVVETKNPGCLILGPGVRYNCMLLRTLSLLECYSCLQMCVTRPMSGALQILSTVNTLWVSFQVLLYFIYDWVSTTTISQLIFMVAGEGIEPPASRLWAWRSTADVPRDINWKI